MRIRSKRASARRARRTGSTAFTLVELMLTLAITGIIGAAVAVMIFAASYGTASQNELRDLLVHNETSCLRLDTALRSARTVLAKGNDYLVLWIADTRANDLVNLSELRRIEFDSDTGELHAYKAPADLTEGEDSSWSIEGTDFDTVTRPLRGSELFPLEVWAVNVSAWSTTPDPANPTEAGYVGFRITTTLDEASETRVGGAALRNH